jgi:serralysin
MASVQADSIESFQCFEIRNYPETEIESVRIALNENPQNALGSTRALPELTDPSVEDDGMSYLAVNIKKNWQPGRTLKIKFLGGEPDLHDKVKQYAKRWLQYANLKFSWYVSLTNPSTLREMEIERSQLK